MRFGACPNSIVWESVAKLRRRQAAKGITAPTWWNAQKNGQFRRTWTVAETIVYGRLFRASLANLFLIRARRCARLGSSAHTRTEIQERGISREEEGHREYVSSTSGATDPGGVSRNAWSPAQAGSGAAANRRRCSDLQGGARFACHGQVPVCEAGWSLRASERGRNLPVAYGEGGPSTTSLLGRRGLTQPSHSESARPKNGGLISVKTRPTGRSAA